ncbi:MAG: hypothetical protein JW929_12990 [Anaerolineales bacterium]|nr:hypothetical protein [Anaerolineales bacterium]
MSGQSRSHGPSIVGPFILIGLGMVLLLQQMKLVQWSLWEIVFRFWPLIIIAVGADILIARRSFLGALASLAVILGLLAGGLFLMGNAPARETRLETDELSYALGDAASGQIDLSMDAGKMEIGSLPEDSGNVVAGRIRQAPTEEVTSSHNFSGSKVYVAVKSNWPRSTIFYTGDGYTWDLDFSRRIPLVFDLSLGAGEIVADLSQLQVTSVEARIGAGSLVLKLPAGSDIDVNVSIGAGSAEVYLPDGAGVKVQCTTGVGNCQLPNGSGFWGQSYTSPNYSEEEYQIRIEISVGVGEAEILS